MVISKSNTILAILVISVLPFATVPFMNSDLSDFSDPNYWNHLDLFKFAFDFVSVDSSQKIMARKSEIDGSEITITRAINSRASFEH